LNHIRQYSSDKALKIIIIVVAYFSGLDQLPNVGKSNVLFTYLLIKAASVQHIWYVEKSKMARTHYKL